MTYASFDAEEFRSQVDSALVSVKRILDTTRNPCLSSPDQDHDYNDKYALATILTNTALAAFRNILEVLGVTNDHLETMAQWVHDDKKAVTMRFKSVQTCEFMGGKQATVLTSKTSTVMERKDKKSIFGGTFMKRLKTTIIKEYHWKISVSYKLCVFAGASAEDDNTITLQSRKAFATVVATRTNEAPSDRSMNEGPDIIDINLTWFLDNFCPEKKISTIRIDRSDPKKCKTPRRNEQIESAFKFFQECSVFFLTLNGCLDEVEIGVMTEHNNDDAYPPLASVEPDHPFCPVLPLFENLGATSQSIHASEQALMSLEEERSPLLAKADIDLLLREQSRTIVEALEAIRVGYPSSADATHLKSEAEAKLELMCQHACALSKQYREAVDYIEHMLKEQLVAAIGKHIYSKDFDDFIRFYYSNKLFCPNYKPTPFCYAVRRPGHYPDGVLSIECSDQSSPSNVEPCDMFTRHIPTGPPIRIRLNAAATVALTGDRYLHGWLRHRFTNGSENASTTNRYQLTARAHQFSCFLVVLGKMEARTSWIPKMPLFCKTKTKS